MWKAWQKFAALLLRWGQNFPPSIARIDEVEKQPRKNCKLIHQLARKMLCKKMTWTIIRYPIMFILEAKKEEIF